MKFLMVFVLIFGFSLQALAGGKCSVSAARKKLNQKLQRGCRAGRYLGSGTGFMAHLFNEGKPSRRSDYVYKFKVRCKFAGEKAFTRVVPIEKWSCY